ncbi:MAG: undecaprenyl-diphosphate phosphatase [Alphaproteobacteria bacterium]
MTLLALIQSMTEFLPVSSSAHLILAERFGFSNQTLATDVALHAGTLVAVMAYFWKDVWHLLTRIWYAGTSRDLCVRLSVATLPVVIAGLFFHTIIETTLRNPLIIAFTAIFFGILLWAVDRWMPHQKNLSDLTIRGAFLIGLAQMLALIPGTSRSGITITCARLLGLNRTEAARFSMLLSIPTIGLGAVYVLGQSYINHTLHTLLTGELAIGFMLAVVFGLLAVWFLMKWVKKASFAIFAVYRVVLGLFLLFYFI